MRTPNPSAAAWLTANCRWWLYWRISFHSLSASQVESVFPTADKRLRRYSVFALKAPCTIWNTAKYPSASPTEIIFHLERSFRSDSVIHFPCSGKMKSPVSTAFTFAGAASFTFFTDLESCDGRWLFFVFSSDFVDAFILVSYWKLKRYLSIPSFSLKSKKIWNSPLFPLYILTILFYIIFLVLESSIFKNVPLVSEAHNHWLASPFPWSLQEYLLVDFLEYRPKAGCFPDYLANSRYRMVLDPVL